MTREIITSNDIKSENSAAGSYSRTAEAARIPSKDGYFDRLFKYIPGEIVAGYIFVITSVKQLTANGQEKLLSWIFFTIFIILTPLYLKKIQKVGKVKQLMISTLSFSVWAFALGGPFALTEWYNPLFGSMILPVFTLIVAIWEAD